MEKLFNIDIYERIKVSPDAMSNAIEEEIKNEDIKNRTYLKIKPLIPIFSIYIMWIVFVIGLIWRIYNIGECIYYLEPASLSTNLALNCFLVFGPVALWIGQSVTEHFGVYRIRKYITLGITLLSFCVYFFQLSYVLAYHFFVPLIFKLPVNVDITKSMIVNLARGVVAVGTVAVPFAFAWFMFKRVFSGENRDMINSFRLNRHFDTRKNKKFLYDSRYVRRLDTGEFHVIKEQDRSLHTLLDGTTGTAKTSGAMSPQIVGDLNQRVYNEDYVKREFYSLLKSKDISITKPFDYFSVDNFRAETEYGKTKMQKVLRKAPLAGATLLAPNASLGDSIYEYAHKRGIKVNRIDPTLDALERHKPGFIGFNPLYIDPEVKGLSRRIEINAKACLFADVLQAVYDMGSKGDPYFSSVNRNVTTCVSILLLLTFEGYHGRQPDPTDVQAIVNDFSRARDYFNALRKMDNSSDYQFVIDFVGYYLLGEGAKEMVKHASGLKMLINDLLINPLFKSVMCATESIDIDRALKNGEITIVNYATELGMSQSVAFGMFFAFTFNNAVMRRPGTEKTRAPHFYYIDEFPVLLHPRFEQMFTYYRQFRVASCVAIQSLDQMKKNPSTSYFEDILLGNTAHHMFYGRMSTHEMEIIEKLGGMVDTISEQKTVNETALSLENTQLSYSVRETMQKEARVDSTKARYQDFMHVFFDTVDNGTPIPPFLGKVNFVPDFEKVGLKRYSPKWHKFFPKENVEPVIKPITNEDFISHTGTVNIGIAEEQKRSSGVCLFEPTLMDLSSEVDNVEVNNINNTSSDDEDDGFFRI